MLRPVLDAFWSEAVWLPPNTTWADVAPGANKAVTYTDHRHIWLPVPMALVLIAMRFVLEKYVYAPFGRSLGIKDARNTKISPNPKLEAAYRANPASKKLCDLAKQLDMAERQVARWWRLRRSQDKPSTLVKFCEDMWKLTYYVCNVCFGVVILWYKDWLWDVDYCYIGYPHQGITNDVWWYFIISSAFYWSLTLTLFRDVPRKDFWQTLVHHVVVIFLLALGWVCNGHRFGTLIILLHECSEIFLEATKAAKHAGYQKLCDCFFAVFTLIWLFTRLGVFPFHIIWSTMYRAPLFIPKFPAAYMIIYLHVVLLGLHVIWTWTIMQVAYKTIKNGQFQDATLTISNSIGILGMDISSDVQFRSHLEDKAKLASKKLVSSIERNGISPRGKYLYYTLVRPHMECCCQLWARPNFGEMEGDIRSSDSEVSDSSHYSDLTPGQTNKGNNKQEFRRLQRSAARS